MVVSGVNDTQICTCKSFEDAAWIAERLNLAALQNQAEFTTALIDCPALHEKGEGYPFGDKVPKKVRLLRRVTTDPNFLGVAEIEPPESSDVIYKTAEFDQVLPCWTNKFGAVAVVFEDGQKLWAKPHEFEVVEWYNK
ncbi:MAG: hypothetical protein M0Q44_01570 [Methylobacter sp.]|jgi:hypothetical protein|nr:hypothetical protein [Methylobacter sp.]